jgi:excisionase family DNA binding protein
VVAEKKTPVTPVDGGVYGWEGTDEQSSLHAIDGESTSRSIEARESLPPVLRVEEMAQVLSIGRSLAYELCRQPGFPVVRLGDKVLRVPTEALFRWINQQSVGRDQ